MNPCFAFCAVLIITGTAQAQNLTAPQLVSAADVGVERDAKGLPLRLIEELTTKGKRLKVGQQVRLETVEAIEIDGTTIPAGSPAYGEITEVRNKGMWGKPGHLSGRVLYLDANGVQVRLAGEFGDKGVRGGVGAVAMSAFVWLPAGFLMTGTSAMLPAGTVINAVVNNDPPQEPEAAGTSGQITTAYLSLPAASPVLVN